MPSLSQYEIIPYTDALKARYTQRSQSVLLLTAHCKQLSKPQTKNTNLFSQLRFLKTYVLVLDTAPKITGQFEDVDVD